MLFPEHGWRTNPMARSAKVTDQLTAEEYAELLKEAQINRLLDFLKALGISEGAWDGIVDWILDGVTHPDVRT